MNEVREFREIQVGAISHNPLSPRKADGKGIQELAESILLNGVLEPILVRAYGHGIGGGYEIIAESGK